MKSNLRVLPAVLLIGLFAVFLTACGGGGGGNEGEEPSSTEQSASAILETQKSGNQYYTELLSQGDPSALEKTVEWLKTQPNVGDSAIGEDGVSIWIKYDSGVEGIILTESFKSLGDTTAQAGAENRLGLRDNITLATTTNKKAIILLPIDSVPGYKDESADDIEGYLQQSGFSVEIYQNEEVTVDLMKTVSNYSFFYMATHGGLGFMGTGLGWNIQVMTGQVANASTMAELWNLLIAGATSGLTIFSPPGTDKTYFGLNENFFDDYTYPGTFVYINACSSFRNSYLADAFLNNGASVYLGWDNTSFLYLSNLHNPEFFQELSRQNNTLSQAYDDTIANQYPGTVYKDDNKNGEYHILLLNGQHIGDTSDTTIDYSLILKYQGDSEYVLNSTDIIPPTASTNLIVTVVSADQIDLSWEASTDNVGVVGYKIYRNGGYLKSVTAISTNDTGLSANTQYCYTVSAYDAAGNESAQSSEACTTTLSAGTPPTAPTNVIATAGDRQVTINWDNISEAASYNIYWSTTSGVTKNTGTKISNITSPYVHAGLTNGITYYDVVTAANSNGESDESSEVSATPKGSIIKFSLPDTGQTLSYTETFGEDSDYTINSLSYTDNGDETVTDNNTGFMWQKEDDNISRTWDEALNYCDELTLAGSSDWRLPSKKELLSIVNYGRYNPAISVVYFPNTNPEYYWSSTTFADNQSNALYVKFNIGSIDDRPKAFHNYVRCVRGGQYPEQSFTDNGDGSVTDNATGLMWQRSVGCDRSWWSALEYCEGRILAGYNDWRLPNIRELETITDDNRYNPAIDTTYFPNSTYCSLWDPITSWTWSSTTSSNVSSFAWHVYFYDGSVSHIAEKSDDLYVRCVRGGQ